MRNAEKISPKHATTPPSRNRKPPRSVPTAFFRAGSGSASALTASNPIRPIDRNAPGKNKSRDTGCRGIYLIRKAPSALAALCSDAFGRSLTARGDGTAAAANALGSRAALGFLPGRSFVVALESLPVEPVVAAGRRCTPVVRGFFPAPRHGTLFPGIAGSGFSGRFAGPLRGAKLLRACG